MTSCWIFPRYRALHEFTRIDKGSFSRFDLTDPCFYFNLLLYLSSFEIKAYLGHSLTTFCCVYMKGKFVPNVSFATVRLINHS